MVLLDCSWFGGKEILQFQIDRLQLHTDVDKEVMLVY